MTDLPLFFKSSDDLNINNYHFHSIIQQIIRSTVLIYIMRKAALCFYVKIFLNSVTLYEQAPSTWQWYSTFGLFD